MLLPKPQSFLQFQEFQESLILTLLLSPSQVLESLLELMAGMSLQPFPLAADDGEEDIEMDPTDADAGNKSSGTKANKKSAKDKTRKPKSGKAKRRSRKKAPSNDDSSQEEGDSRAYKPGSFNELRMTFIREKRAKEKLSWADANQAWMLSSERAGALSGMGEAELKRRRFA